MSIQQEDQKISQKNLTEPSEDKVVDNKGKIQEKLGNKSRRSTERALSSEFLALL